MAMIIARIVLGLLGLGIVVFVHELGHFLAARLVGINVDAFSIGWGNPLLKKKIGNTEYRLGMFPIGGYCKMQGHNDMTGMEENSTGEPPAKGSYFAASPLQRSTVCFAGPLFNMLFAVIVLSFIWGIGFERETLENRIVLESDFNAASTYPADAAHLKTGDRIIEIDGARTDFFHEIRENIIFNAERSLPITVERDGEILNLFVQPDSDKTGAGIIGISPWVDAVVEGIIPSSDAAIAGFLPGDRITQVNGTVITHASDFMRALEGSPPVAEIDVMRNGVEERIKMVHSQDKGIGIIWPYVQYHTPVLSPIGALAKGASESWKTLTRSITSIPRLFNKNIDPTQAISGPVRITYMLGEVATDGFGQNFATGLRYMMQVLAIISIAIGIMNLLPLPVLDGGQIILFILEMIRRKPLPAKAIGVFQTVGMVLIGGLMIFALFGDILYLTHR
jgi:regulator of sigma E protease